MIEDDVREILGYAWHELQWMYVWRYVEWRELRRILDVAMFDHEYVKYRKCFAPCRGYTQEELASMSFLDAVKRIWVVSDRPDVPIDWQIGPDYAG